MPGPLGLLKARTLGRQPRGPYLRFLVPPAFAGLVVGVVNPRRACADEMIGRAQELAHGGVPDRLASARRPQNHPRPGRPRADPHAEQVSGRPLIASRNRPPAARPRRVLAPRQQMTVGPVRRDVRSRGAMRLVCQDRRPALDTADSGSSISRGLAPLGQRRVSSLRCGPRRKGRSPRIERLRDNMGHAHLCTLLG